MNDKYKSPRLNQGEGQKNPFVDELGMEKSNKDSDSVQDSYTLNDSGWIPILAGDKKNFKFSLYDNSQIPGSPYPGRDSQDGFGSPFSGAGESPLRNDETKSYTKDFPAHDIQLYHRIKNERERTNDTSDKADITEAKEKKMDWRKIAAKREKRRESIYEIEEDYSVYGRYCSGKKCAGVFKELLGWEEKRKLGIERTDLVWRCNNCGELTSAIGSVSEQTSGFSGMSSYDNHGPVVENESAFDPTNEIRKDRDRTKR